MRYQWEQRARVWHPGRGLSVRGLLSNDRNVLSERRDNDQPPLTFYQSYDRCALNDRSMRSWRHSYLRGQAPTGMRPHYSSSFGKLADPMRLSSSTPMLTAGIG